MSNLKVKLVLDLINRIKGPADAARRDLRGVGQEADRLKAKGGPEKLRRDLMFVASDSRKAAGGLRDAASAADRLNRTGGADRLRQGLKGVEDQARRTGKALAGLQGRDERGRFTAGAGGSGGTTLAMAGRNALMPLAAGFGLYGATRATVGQSISFEKAMADVRKKIDLPEGESMEGLERTIVKLAIALGQSRENMAGIVAEAGAAGVAFKDLEGFTRLAAKAATAWDMSTSDASQKLFELRSANGWNLQQLEEFADKVNALGDTSAAKERDILEMANRVIAAAKEGGVSTDTSLAFITAMRSVGIQPEIGARGFNALVTKMATADESKKVSEGLKDLGLNARVMARTMKTDATKALLDLFRALDKSKDPVKAAVKIFGQEWFDEMLRTKGSVAEVIKNLEMLRDPKKWRGSTQRNLDIELSTTAKHLEQLKSLASEVGDRLGRWALPGINEAVKTLIAGLNDLDRRAEQKKTDEEIARKKAEGQPLNDAERKREMEDRAQGGAIGRRANQISQQIDGSKTMDRVTRGEVNDPIEERNRLLARQLDRRISQLEADLAAAGPNHGRNRDQRRLETLRAQRKALEVTDTTPLSPIRRPADQDDRALERERVAMLQRQATALQEQIARLTAASQESRPGEEKAGFRADITAATFALRQVLAQFRPLGPVPGSNFSTGAARDRTGSSRNPAGATTTAPGSGRLGFGLGGPQAVKDAFTIDLGEAGMTTMDRYAAGLRAGQPKADSAASSVSDSVRTQLSGVDATSDGQRVGESFAGGIRASIPSVAAAANELADVVNRSLARANGAGAGSSAAATVRNRISGSPFDGVAP